MKQTPDYDLAPYLARGRTLRAQAFLAAFYAIRGWIAGAGDREAKPAGCIQNA